MADDHHFECPEDEDCCGCRCHITPPCNHCVNHVVIHDEDPPSNESCHCPTYPCSHSTKEPEEKTPAVSDIKDHLDCEVVTSVANGQTFKYCRNCKIEVESKLSADVTVKTSLSDSYNVETASGSFLDQLGALHGLVRSVGAEPDEDFRKRLIHYIRS